MRPRSTSHRRSFQASIRHSPESSHPAAPGQVHLQAAHAAPKPIGLSTDGITFSSHPGVALAVVPPVVHGFVDKKYTGARFSTLVLSASAKMPACLGPNVVVPLLSNMSPEGGELALSRDGLELAFRSGRTLALGGSTPQVLKSGEQSATLHIPGRPSLAILGANQIKIFERLVAAHKAGSPDVKAIALTEGMDVQSPQQAFRKETWQSIVKVYIGKGAKHGFWRLIVDAPPTEEPV